MTAKRGPVKGRGTVNVPDEKKGRQKLAGIQGYEDLEDIAFGVPVTYTTMRDLSSGA
jgi:hypothetical protein